MEKMSDISWRILLVSVIGAPLVFIPSPSVTLDAVKTIWIATLVIASAIFCTIHFIKSGRSNFSDRDIYIPVIIVSAIVILSSVLSSDFYKSFFGQGFELLTGGLLIIGMIAYIIAYIHSTKERIAHVVLLLHAGFILIVILQILNAFFPGTFNLNILPDASSTIIGKWYDLSIYAGVVLLGSIISLKHLSMNSLVRAGFIVTLVLSLCALVMTNFPHVWLGLAISSIIAIMYYWYQSSTETKVFSKISPYFAILLIVSALFFFLGNSKMIGSFIQKAGLAESEVRLPWRYTVDVAAGTLKDSPLLGSGPNRFVNEYLKYKSPEINQSPFWNIEFSDGFGFLPTLLITTGILGFLAFVLFGFSVIRRGVAASKNSSHIKPGSFDEYCLLVTGLPLLLLTVILVIYMPSISMVFMFFVMAGLFVRVSSINGGENIVKKNITVAIGVLAIIALATVWVFYARKVVASIYFQSGISILSDGGDIEDGRRYFESALSWHHADIYYQALSEINLIKISSIASNIKTTPDKETIDSIVGLINQAIDYTGRATALDPDNYYNYVAEARAFETATFLKMEGAKEKALASYREAIMRNPKNPALYVSLARFTANLGEYALSKQYIGEAIKIKQNYTDAVFALVQIQVAEGNIDDAIVSAEVATQISPNDPIAFFQLGLLHYNSKSYEKAVSAFEKALTVSPNYANAAYFLGLSYARTGKIPSAVSVFEKLLKENPNNAEISLILSNLKSGASPFTGVESPINQTPEKRSTLPLKDTVTPAESLPTESPEN